MNLQNYLNFGMCIYENDKTYNGKYKLGDVLINGENEIGVIIQLHDGSEFRTDMFGNSSESEVRMASENEISQYRPNIKNEGNFKHKTQLANHN